MFLFRTSDIFQGNRSSEQSSPSDVRKKNLGRKGITPDISYTRIELCHASVECIENVESIFTINQLSIELAGSFDVSSESVYIYTFPNVLSVPLREIDDLYRVMQSNLP